MRCRGQALQENNVPKDNIEFWMSKATGSASQDQLEEVVYEGLGPGSVQMVVRALTDNRKRTFPNVRHQFKCGEQDVSDDSLVAFCC